MKKIAFAIASLCCFTLTAIANPPKTAKSVNQAALRELKQRFADIQNLRWYDSKNDMVRADFNDCKGRRTAYFSQKGDWIATTRDCTTNELPEKLKADLIKRFSDANIISLCEMESDTEHAWYVKIEKDGKTKVYRGLEYGKLQQTFLKI